MFNAEKEGRVMSRGWLSRGSQDQAPQGFEVQVRRLTLIVSAMRIMGWGGGISRGVALIQFQILQDRLGCCEERDCRGKGGSRRSVRRLLPMSR